MRSRKLKISVKVGGMKLPIATIVIKKFADMLTPQTKLVCRECGKEPVYAGGYKCECGKEYKHWSQLKRVLPSGKEVVKARLIPEKADLEADAYVMDKEEFAKYVDATLAEYGVSVKDQTSADNLKKMVIALTNLNKVIVLKFADTYEERICILTLSASGRIILKEIIPLNLLKLEETLRADLKGLKPEEIAEAEAFIKQLPKVSSEEIFKVNDYRIIGLEEQAIIPQAVELSAIIERMKKEKVVT